MTTALRLPDPFTPGTTAASAATPTCCCCCCCCAVASVSGAIALPSGLANDLAEAGRPRRGAFWVLPASLFLPGVLASPFLVEEHWAYYVLGGAICALLWTFAAEKLAGAPHPGRSAVRLAFWMLMFIAEVFVVLPVVGVVSQLGAPAAVLFYALLVIAAGWRVRRFYARRAAA